MKTIKIKKLSNGFSDNYCVELIENQKVSEIYYVKKPEFVFDIILQNIKEFKEIELRFFLNLANGNKFYTDKRPKSLFIKRYYKTTDYDFEKAVDYDYLKKIILVTLNRRIINDRISIKF